MVKVAFLKSRRKGPNSILTITAGHNWRATLDLEGPIAADFNTTYYDVRSKVGRRVPSLVYTEYLLLHTYCSTP